ncbi:sugar-transfer associated ATP-grasp domain-containing protein [Facklamia sp. P12950]|uniref:sugar-transfer associated ATP-grasp domain-containing protein n=1 Tax=Facklamia sp. P12950 TaxID=3421951 RepID=UPI003D170024
MSNEDHIRITGYNDDKGISYLRSRFKKYNLLIDRFIDSEMSFLKRLHISVDFIFSVIFLGAGINDYFQYNFYYRKYNDRKRFIVGRKWLYMVKKFNGSLTNELIDDKSHFNSLYDNFLGRDWLDTSIASEEEFLDFVKKHPTFIYKIKVGSGGNGIGIYKSQESKSLINDFLDFKKNNLIIEEIIHQHSEMKKFNPSSVNTIRLVTVVNNEEVEIVHAVFRAGSGKGFTDNFHHLGIAALIDIELGIVYTQGINKLNEKFIVHPYSHKEIIGFHIPYWTKVKATVKNAALINPEIRYIGWDVSIKEDGTICIIEGNCASDPDITQMPDQIGKWEDYKKYIN